MNEGVPLPPRVDQIPLSTFMMLPLPFSKDSVKEFNRCHLGKMFTIEFITKGTWDGYQVMALDSVERPISVGEPMVRVRFARLIISATSSNSTAIKFSSQGGFTDAMSDLSLDGFFDVISTFTLEGFLNEGDAKLEIKKIYSAGSELPGLPMQGVMAPFGILATFGGLEEQRREDRRDFSSHWLWLWKSRWSSPT
ncbi:hypothetical protein B0J14DRAFT_21804 [Halenospora varia]|nr:hypothetical protein B0J14DRAFT_21804 [Halenospora varia]